MRISSILFKFEFFPRHIFWHRLCQCGIFCSIRWESEFLFPETWDKCLLYKWKLKRQTTLNANSFFRYHFFLSALLCVTALFLPRILNSGLRKIKGKTKSPGCLFPYILLLWEKGQRINRKTEKWKNVNGKENAIKEKALNRILSQTCITLFAAHFFFSLSLFLFIYLMCRLWHNFFSFQF